MSAIYRHSLRASAATASALRRGSGCRRARIGFPVPGVIVALAHGFTLLELLVVIVLLALITALAIPNLERLHATLTSRGERDYILDQFAGLSRQAMLQGRAYVVFGTGATQQPEPAEPGRQTAGAAPAVSHRQSDGHSFEAPSPAGHERYVIDVPKGWAIQLDAPLIVRANGICLGAELTLHHRGAVDIRISLAPPYCRIDPDA